MVVTQHTSQVLEVLKDDGTVGSRPQIHVLQLAGTLDVEGRIISTDPSGIPVFTVGQELLLFLEDWPEAKGYAIRGPVGAYVLDTESVRLPDAAKGYARAFGNKRTVSRAEFLSVLRSKAKARAK